MMFSIPFVPGSKKNAYRQRRRGQPGRPVYSGKALQEGALRALLCAEMSRRGLAPIPRDSAVGVEIVVHEGKRPEDNYVMLHVFDIGPRRSSGKPGRPCDLDGIVTTILDGMNKAVFADDVQVTRLTATRRVAVPE